MIPPIDVMTALAGGGRVTTDRTGDVEAAQTRSIGRQRA